MATIKKSHEASWKPGGTAKHVIYLPVSYLVLFMKIDFNENIHIYSVHYINSPCNTCWLMNVHGNFTWLRKQNRYFYSTLQKPKVSEMHDYQPAQFYPLFFSHFPLEQWQRDAEPRAAPTIFQAPHPLLLGQYLDQGAQTGCTKEYYSQLFLSFLIPLSFTMPQSPSFIPEYTLATWFFPQQPPCWFFESSFLTAISKIPHVMARSGVLCTQW